MFPTNWEYGTCPCSGAYDRRAVEVRMTVDGRNAVVSAVPQGNCAKCGGRVYKAGDLIVVEALLRGTAVVPGAAVSSVG